MSFKILRALCLKSKSQNSFISLGQIREKSICFYAFLTCLIVHGTAKHVYTTLPLEYSHLFFSVLSKIYANTTNSNLKRSSSNIEIVYLFSSSENRWQIILRKKHLFIYLFMFSEAFLKDSSSLTRRKRYINYCCGIPLHEKIQLRDANNLFIYFLSFFLLKYCLGPSWISKTYWKSFHKGFI